MKRLVIIALTAIIAIGVTVCANRYFSMEALSLDLVDQKDVTEPFGKTYSVVKRNFSSGKYSLFSWIPELNIYAVHNGRYLVHLQVVGIASPFPWEVSYGDAPTMVVSRIEEDRILSADEKLRYNAYDQMHYRIDGQNHVVTMSKKRLHLDYTDILKVVSSPSDLQSLIDSCEL